jgi:hypothetical protein
MQNSNISPSLFLFPSVIIFRIKDIPNPIILSRKAISNISKDVLKKLIIKILNILVLLIVRENNPIPTNINTINALNM